MYVPYGDLDPLLPFLVHMEVRGVREDGLEIEVEVFSAREKLEEMLRQKFAWGWGSGATEEEVAAAAERTSMSMEGNITDSAYYRTRPLNVPVTVPGPRDG